jgi:hypothetical protein
VIIVELPQPRAELGSDLLNLAILQGGVILTSYHHRDVGQAIFIQERDQDANRYPAEKIRFSPSQCAAIEDVFIAFVKRRAYLKLPRGELGHVFVKIKFWSFWRLLHFSPR